MFQLPQWLVAATGAQQFANNPANNFMPTAGDALQGIGHSMMEHYRRSMDMPAPSGSQPPGVPGGAPPQVSMPQAQRMMQMDFPSGVSLPIAMPGRTPGVSPFGLTMPTGPSGAADWQSILGRAF